MVGVADGSIIAIIITHHIRNITSACVVLQGGKSIVPMRRIGWLICQALISMPAPDRI
jgi:hypothetical protein